MQRQQMRPQPPQQQIEGIAGRMGKAAQPRRKLKLTAVAAQQARSQGAEVEKGGEQGGQKREGVIPAVGGWKLEAGIRGFEPEVDIGLPIEFMSCMRLFPYRLPRPRRAPSSFKLPASTPTMKAVQLPASSCQYPASST